MRTALLFDLDDTLIVEEPAAVAAFEATAKLAAANCGVEPEGLALDARARARELWYESPAQEYCMRVGISSWEGLWCRFEGDGRELEVLRRWSSQYRRETWGLALPDQGVEDHALAAELGERFGAERRARHEVFDDVVAALERLSESQRLALVTNGAACLQREKLAASGLGDYFEVVFISAELSVAKPDAFVFGQALARLRVDGDQAVMVGDSIRKDVDGASAAGLGAVWLNRRREKLPTDRPAPIQIRTLGDLPDALSRIA